MSYELHCIKCAEEISAEQYDAYLGMCPDCAEDAEDLNPTDDADYYTGP